MAASSMTTHSGITNLHLLLFAATATAYTVFCRSRRRSNTTTTKTTTTTASTDTTEYKGIEKRPCPNVSWREALDQQAAGKVKPIFVDTRTPKEFALEHVWKAINIPLLNNAQRHVVGSTYHQQSKEAAIEKGWEYFTPIITEFIERFRPYQQPSDDDDDDDDDDSIIYVYCWRGGMRSRIVTNLLILHGFRAVQIQGGFKAYMNEIVWKGLEEFAGGYKPNFIVLFGHTGCRKTEILHRLKQQENLPVLDLEGLAGHKGSIYGTVNQNGHQPQKSQKMFSIGLYHSLLELSGQPLIFCEGEANKIGNVHLPEFMFQRILHDPYKILVTATMETRVKVIKREYFGTPECVEQLHQITSSSITLQRVAGKKNVQELHDMLDNESRHDEFIEWLLVHYYDQRYRFDKFGHDYQLTLSSDGTSSDDYELDECCRQMREFYQTSSEGFNGVHTRASKPLPVRDRDMGRKFREASVAKMRQEGNTISRP